MYKPIAENWYLIYEGTSTDGRGSPTFKHRTTDIDLALKALKAIYKNPYSTGKVEIVTDSGIEHATLERLKQIKTARGR